jgi:hypothetical protein
MFQQSSEQKMARHVQALYNYHVGQPKEIGKLILWALVVAPVVALVLALFGHVITAIFGYGFRMPK